MFALSVGAAECARHHVVAAPVVPPRDAGSLPLTGLPAGMELVDDVGLALASHDDRAVLRLVGLQRGSNLQWILLRGVPNALVSFLIERTEVRGYSEAI